MTSRMASDAVANNPLRGLPVTQIIKREHDMVRELYKQFQASIDLQVGRGTRLGWRCALAACRPCAGKTHDMFCCLCGTRPVARR